MIKIDIIAGARPNFIKIAPIIHEITISINFRYRLIHTGQHYDKKMSDNFFTQLEIPKPNKNLGVGSGSQAEQTAGIMIGYEAYLKDTYKPDLCIVVGDVNSTMACAIVAKKENIKIAHIEAGIRSNDLKMPEEINRILTDSITDYYFTTSVTANKNLLDHGVKLKNIFFVGNVMIDTLKKFESRFYPPQIFLDQKLNKDEYYVLTLHRPSNVDNDEKLFNILGEIDSHTMSFKVIYPVHPRVKSKLDSRKHFFKNIIEVEPMPYLEFNYLVKNAKGVITDSGGITEEATVYNVPCITLRKNTERPETLNIGTNVLVKKFPDEFRNYISLINKNEWKKSKVPEKWDGNTATRIVKHIQEIFNPSNTL